MTEHTRTVAEIVREGADAATDNHPRGLTPETALQFSRMEVALWDLIEVIAQLPGIDMTQLVRVDEDGSRANELVRRLESDTSGLRRG